MIGGLNSLGVRTHEVGLVPSIQAAVKRVNRAGIVVRVRASDFTQPLGRMSAKANEFTKSLEASNARVIAFGASAAIIGGVTTAFSQLVIQAAKVEKILADINAVLDTSSENLRKFGDGLFNVARNTSQALEIAAEAALEFSRQGLSMEETLKRTNDALILTRLTGLAAADSVKGLTAAVNGFADAGLTTTEIINKLAAVDVKFAVSADDLINALARAGAVAQDAGVDFDSLVGAVTSAQQITARGGAVIGNSFKTIFTRLQRSSTLDRLQELGVAVRDLQGNTLPAINILTELSRSYDTLGSATKAAIAEQVGGVFQINILKAALKDLGKENSLYAQATQTASDATNEAYRKNEMLQKTLSSIANQTLTTVRELTANLGDLTIAPALTSFLDSINGALSAISDLFGEKEGESIGSDFAKGLARAVGSVLTGPGMFGLVLIFGKLFGQAFKFAKNSVKDLLQIKSIKDQELAIQESIVDAMLSNVELQQTLLRLDGDQLKQEQLVLNVLKDQTNMLEKQRSIASNIAPGLRQAGVQPNLIVDAGKNKGATTRTNKSSGHIPTPMEEAKEKAGAKKAGYTAGPISTMSIPRLGRVVYNKNETVKKFQGMDQPAIMPPEYSRAGKQYKNDFGAKHGFDPYANQGLIPNFVKYDRSTTPWKAIPDGASFTDQETKQMRKDGWALTDKEGWHFVGGGKQGSLRKEQKEKEESSNIIASSSGIIQGSELLLNNNSGEIYYGSDIKKIALENNLMEDGKIPSHFISGSIRQEYDPTIDNQINKLLINTKSTSNLSSSSIRKLKDTTEKDNGVLILSSDKQKFPNQKVVHDPYNFYGEFNGASRGLIPHTSSNFSNQRMRPDRRKRRSEGKPLNLEYFYPSAGQGGSTIFKMYKDIVRSADSGQPYTNILAGEIIGPRIPKMIVECKRMLDKARSSGKKIPKMSIQGTIFPSMLTRKIDKFASDRKDGYIHPTIDYIPKEENEVRKYLKMLGANPESHDTVKLQNVYKSGYNFGFIPNFASQNWEQEKSLGSDINMPKPKISKPSVSEAINVILSNKGVKLDSISNTEIESAAKKYIELSAKENPTQENLSISGQDVALKEISNAIQGQNQYHPQVKQDLTFDGSKNHKYSQVNTLSNFIPNFALKAGLIPGTNILRLPTAKMINETTASDFKGNKIKGWQTLEATVDNIKKHALTYSRELDALKSVGVDILQRKMYFSNQSQHIPVKDRKNIARQQKKMKSMKGFASRNQHKITGNSQEDALFKSSLKDKGYYPTWTGAYTAKGRQEGKGDENFKVDFFAPGRKPIESKYGKYTAPNLIAKSIRLYSDSYIEEFLSKSGRSDLSENMRKGKLKDSSNMLTSLGYKDVNADMVLRAGLFNGYLPKRKNNVNQNLRTVKELEDREIISGYSAMSSSEMFDKFSSNSDRDFPRLEKISKDGIGDKKRIKSRKKDPNYNLEPEGFYHEGVVPNFSRNWAQGKSKSSDKNQGRKRSPQSEVIKAIRATLSKRGIKRSAMAEDKIVFAAEKYIKNTKSGDYPGGYVNINGNKINLNEITLALKKHGDYHPSFQDTVEFDGSKNHKDNLMFEELDQKRLPNFARYGMSSFRSPIMFKNGNEGSFGRSYLATTSKSGKLFLLKDGHKPFSDYMKKMGKPEPKLKEGTVGGREGYWVNSGADDVKTWAELPNTKLLASQEKRRAEAQAREDDRKARLNPGVFDPVLSNGKIFFSDGSSGYVDPDFLSKKMGKEYKHVEVDKRALYNYAKENKITKKIGGTESAHLGSAFNKILSLPRSKFLKMKHIIRPRMQTDKEKDVERKMNAPSRPIKWDVRDNQKGKKQFNLKADDTTFRQFAKFLLDQGVPKRSVDNIHKALANKQAHLDAIVKEAKDKRSMGRGRGVFFDAAKKQESFEKGFSIPTDGLFIKNLNKMVSDFNKTVYNSDGFIPNFANRVYDRDKIQPGLAGDILNKILSNRKKKNLLLGPSGVGKTTMAAKYGSFIQNLEDAQTASSYTILSGAAKTKKGGVSPALQNIINAVNQSGGTVSYLSASDEVIEERRNKRIEKPVKGDLRSTNQLKGTRYAPKNQPDFISNVKKLSARFQNIQASNGFVPNFASKNWEQEKSLGSDIHEHEPKQEPLQVSQAIRSVLSTKGLKSDAVSTNDIELASKQYMQLSSSSASPEGNLVISGEKVNFQEVSDAIQKQSRYHPTIKGNLGFDGSKNHQDNIINTFRGFVPNFMLGNKAPDQSTLYPTAGESVRSTQQEKVATYNRALKDFLAHQDKIGNKAWTMSDVSDYIDFNKQNYGKISTHYKTTWANLNEKSRNEIHQKINTKNLQKLYKGFSNAESAQAKGAAYEAKIQEYFGVQSLGHNAPIDYKNLGQKVSNFRGAKGPGGKVIKDPKFTLLSTTTDQSPVEAAAGKGHLKDQMGQKGPRFAAQNHTGYQNLKNIIKTSIQNKSSNKTLLQTGKHKIVELAQEGRRDQTDKTGYDESLQAFNVISTPEVASNDRKQIINNSIRSKQANNSARTKRRADRGGFNIDLFNGYGKSAHLIGSQKIELLEEQIEKEINKSYQNELKSKQFNEKTFISQLRKSGQTTFYIKYDKDILDLNNYPIKPKSHGHIPNFAAWNPFTKETQSIAKRGGLATSKFSLAEVIKNSPFKDLLLKHKHWNKFPEKHKNRLNQWLKSQGYTNRALQAWGLLSKHSKSIASGVSDFAAHYGHIPNFSNPLTEAISREKHALREQGSSADIYIDQDNRLKNPKNPAGLLVANTRDEPKSGSQGVNRAISMGIDPKTHGASNGVVPNFQFMNKQGLNVPSAKSPKPGSSNQFNKDIKDTGKAMKEAGDASGDLMMKMMGLTTLTYALDGAMGEASETASGFQKTMGVVNAAIMGASQAAMLAMVVPKGTSAKGREKWRDGRKEIKNAYGSKNQSTGSRLKAGLGGAGMMAKGAGGVLMGALGPLGMAAAALIPIFSALKEQFGLFKSNIENISDSLNAARKQQELLNQATSSLSSEQQNAKSIIELESKGRNLSSEQMNELHKLRIQEIQNQGKLQGSLESVSANFDLSDKQLKLLNGSYADQQKLLKQLESAQTRYISSLELRRIRAENREKLGDTEAGIGDFFLGQYQKTIALGEESANNIARGEADTFYETYMSGKINEGNAQEVNKQISGIVALNLSKLRDGDVFDYQDFARNDEFQNQLSDLGKTLGYKNNPEEGPDLNEFKRRMAESMASVNAQSYFSGAFGTNFNPGDLFSDSAKFTQDEQVTSKTFKRQLQRRVSGAEEDDAAKIARKNEQVNLIDIANESNKMAKQISFEQDRALSLAKQRLKIEQKIFEQDQARLGLTDEIEDFLGVLNVDEKVDRKFDRKEAAIDQKAEQDIKSLRIDSRAESKKFLEDKIKTDRLNNSMFDPMTGINQDKVEKLLREIADNTDPNSKATSKEETDFANKFEMSAVTAMKDGGLDLSSFNKEKKLTEQLNKADMKQREIYANYQDENMRKMMFEQNPEAKLENIQRLFNERVQARADNPIFQEIIQAQADFTSRYKEGISQVMADFRERKQVVSRPDATRIYEQSSDYRNLKGDMDTKIQDIVQSAKSGSKNHKKPTTKVSYDNEDNELTHRLVEGNKLRFPQKTLYDEVDMTTSRVNKLLLSKTELELQKSLKIQERITKEATSPAHLNQLYLENPRANPEHISNLKEQIKDLSEPPADKTPSKYDFKGIAEFILKAKGIINNLKAEGIINNSNFSNRSTLSGSANPDAATDNINEKKNREKEEAISSIDPVTPREKALMNNASSPQLKDIQAEAKRQDTADRIELGEANAEAKGVMDGTRISDSKTKDKANALTNREQTIVPALIQKQQINGMKYDFSPSVSNPGVFGQTGDMPLVNPNDPIYPINQARMGKDLALPVSTPDKIDGKSTEARAKSEAEINKIMSEIFIQLRDHKKIAGGVVDKTKARSIIIDGLLQLDDDIERGKAIELLNTSNVTTYTEHEIDLIKQGLNQKQATLSDQEQAIQQEKKANKDDLDLQKLSESFRNRTNAGLQETLRIRGNINNYEERVSDAVQHNLGVQSGFAELSSEMLNVQIGKLRSMERDGSLVKKSESLANEELGKEEKQRILGNAILKARNNLLDDTKRGVQISEDNFGAQEEERRSTLIAAKNKLKLSNLSEKLYKQAETESAIKVAQLAIENKLLAQKTKLYETTEALTKEVEAELEQQRQSAYNAGLRNQESNRVNDQIITNPNDPYFGMTGFQANAQQRAQDLNIAQTSQVKNARADFQLYTGRGNELRASETRLQLLQFQKQQNIENGKGRMFSDTIAVRIAEVNVELDRFNETLANTTFDSVRQGFRDMMDTMASGTAEMSDVFGAFLGSIVSAISDKLIDRATAQITSGLFDIIGIGDYNRGGIVGYNRGGYAMGGKSSQTPAMLTAGEYVVRKKVVDRLGAGTLDKMNKTGSLDSLYQEPSTDNFDISTSNGAPGMAFMNEGGWLSRQWDAARSTFSPFTSSSSDSSWGKVAKGSGMLLGSAYGAYEEGQKNAADNAPEAPQAPSTAVLNTISDLSLDPSSSSMSPSMRQGGNSYAQQYGDYLLKKYDYDVQQQNQAVEAKAGFWQGMANKFGVALGGAAVGKFTSALGAAWDTRGGSEATVKRWNERGINNAADLAEKSPNSFGYYKNAVNDYRERMNLPSMSTDAITSGKPITASAAITAPSCSGGVCSTSDNLGITKDNDYRTTFYSPEQIAFSDHYNGKALKVGGIDLKNSNFLNNGYLKRSNGGIIDSPIQGYSSGGKVYGPGGIDKVGPVMLDKGEYVVRASSVNSIEKQFPGFFDQLNAMKFNQGGSVGGTQSKSGSSSQQSGNVTVNINVASDGSSSSSSNGGGSEQQMASKIKDAVIGIIAQEKRVGGMLSG